MSYRLSIGLSVKLTGGFYKVSSYLCIGMHAFVHCNKPVSNDFKYLVTVPSDRFCVAVYVNFLNSFTHIVKIFSGGDCLHIA